jgi:hypothetical protein
VRGPGAIIGFPLLLISLIFAVQLDKEVSLQIQKLTDIAQQQLKIAKSQNNIALNQMLYNDPNNIGIIDAIENKKPILKSATSDGQFSSAQLDKYLGDFETVQEVYQEGLLSVEQLCTSFSTYIREA